MAKKKRAEVDRLVPVLGLVGLLGFSVVAAGVQTGLFTKAKVTEIVKTVHQPVAFEPPKWAETGVLLTDAEVAARFDSVLYTRNSMAPRIGGYRTAGFGGKAMITMIANALAGPVGLDAELPGGRVCTTAERGYTAPSAYADMDTGDFCQIHEAIRSGTALTDYPDLIPTRDWFLHLPNGNRMMKTSGNMGIYRVNPANAGVREYIKRRVLRELKATDPSHAPLDRMDGVLLDKVEIGWQGLQNDCNWNTACPVEFPGQSTAFLQGVKGLVAGVDQYLGTNAPGKLLWGKLEIVSTVGLPWSDYRDYLDGGVEANLAFHGDGSTRSGDLRPMLNGLRDFGKWGKMAIAIAPGWSDRRMFDYALGLFLLTTNGSTGEFYYADRTDYGKYFDDPKLVWDLGKPLGDYTTDGASLYYTRNFTCGSVVVSTTMNHQYATITRSPCITPTPKPTIGPTPTLVPNCNKKCGAGGVISNCPAPLSCTPVRCPVGMNCPDVVSYVCRNPCCPTKTNCVCQ